MNTKHNQKGFAHAVIILVILVVVLIALIGGIVYRANKAPFAKTYDPVKIEDKTPVQKADSGSSSDKQAVPYEPKPVNSKKVGSEQNGYIVFTDLGFKIPKSAAMSDWSYWQESDKSMTVYVQSAAHVKEIDTCNAGTQAYDESASVKSFAGFSRVEGNFTEQTNADAFMKQFDGFYLDVGWPNGGSPCSNENGPGYPVGRVPQGANEALTESLKNAVKL